MASRQRRLKVWLYSTRKDDHRATSIACKTSILSTGGNSTNMQKHLSTQHAITLQECHVFDSIRSDDNVNESQPSNSSAANVSASSVNIEGKLLQTLSIVLVPLVSLCKPAFTICSCQFYFLVQGEYNCKKNREPLILLTNIMW